MSEPPYLTQEGAERLRAELVELKGPMRQDIAQRLRSAISMGDLSENADYHKAKEDQAFLEGRIMELEYILKNAIIVEQRQGNRDLVEVGAKVVVQDEEEEAAETYHLVGAKEADPRSGKISNESPIGRALIGRRQGETIQVETPGGTVTLKILKIE
jgi:transcription elongation factor GreA